MPQGLTGGGGVQLLAGGGIGDRARLEGHPRDRGLALAGGGVARAGGKVDGGVGDRLRLLLGVLLLRAGGGLLGPGLGGGARPGGPEPVALGDDVRDEVRAGNLRTLARSDLLALVLG